VDLLTDEAHAAVQEWTSALLIGYGWEVLVETSFNVFGERGRIDLLAWHRPRRILVVVEVKSRIEDAQDTVGRLDVKVRLASRLAEERGWSPELVLPALIVSDDRTSQRRVAEHPGLFRRFDARGRSATAWLRNPSSPAPNGILMFVRAPTTTARNAAQSARLPIPTNTQRGC
jgi:Holliday junction resolvase-like predicted endonuclease